MGRKRTIKTPRTPTQMLNFHPVIHRGAPQVDAGCHGGDLISNKNTVVDSYGLGGNLNSNFDTEGNFPSHQNNDNSITTLNDPKKYENISQINQLNQKNGGGGNFKSSSNKNKKQGDEKNSYSGDSVDNTESSHEVTQAKVSVDEQYWMLPGAVFTESG